MNKINLNMINIKTCNISYKIIGAGSINVAIELGLGSCIAEWENLANEIAKKGNTVLIYERAGTGYSTPSSLERTPYNISKEFNLLLDSLNVTEPLTIIAHSQGAIYAQAFARYYSKRVKKIIFVDPLSANDNKFKELLTKEEYSKSGVDKFSNLGFQKTLAKLHLGFIIKLLMKSAPPFYYYKDFTPDETNYILSSLTKASLYETAMQEYKLSHCEDLIKDLKDKNGFPNIPIVTITHSSDFCIEETMKFGYASKETAEKVENIWQNLMKEYLSFSDNSTFVQSKNSGHYIHLLDPELILNNI